MRFRPTIAALTFWAFSALPAVSQESLAEKSASPTRAEVLVLGVYHMSNPGHDIFNMQADDVLAPKRQQEIAQLIEVLKRFHPTKIAIEAGIWSQRAGREYSDYVAGKYTLSRNEIDQIGYRLAKELGHKNVYPVDVDGEFPFQRIVNYAKASGRSKELDALLGEIGGMVKAQNAYLASHTVLETLLYMKLRQQSRRGRGLLLPGGALRRARRLGRRRPGLRLVPAQHAHLQQRRAARRLSERARADHLRCRTPRLAATRLRQQPQPPLAQARRVRQVTPPQPEYNLCAKVLEAAGRQFLALRVRTCRQLAVAPDTNR